MGKTNKTKVSYKVRVTNAAGSTDRAFTTKAAALKCARETIKTSPSWFGFVSADVIRRSESSLLLIATLTNVR